MKNECDWTPARCFARTYVLAMKWWQRKLTLPLPLSQPRHVQWTYFWVVWGLFLDSGEVWGAHSEEGCEQFATYFTSKIDHICLELDSRFEMQNQLVHGCSACLLLWDKFQIILPEDVDRIFAVVRPTSCMLNDPCSFWLLKAARSDLIVWWRPINNSSLFSEEFDHFCENNLWTPSNYRSVSNLPFLDKVFESALTVQLQGFLDDTKYLDPLQPSFRPGFRMET